MILRGIEMIQTKTVELVGQVVFWNCASSSNRQKIVDGISETGIKNCDPPERTAIAAARIALEDATHAKGCIVRPLEKNIGLVALQERQGQEENQYEPVVFVHVNDDGITKIGFPGVRDYSEQTAIETTIRSRFSSAIVECDQNHIGKSLANLVRHLGGVMLKPNGGVYWLPAYSDSLWAKVVKIFEGAALKGTTMVHAIQTAKDDAAVRAIHESLRKEVEERVAEIKEEIVSKGNKGLRKDAVVARTNELKALLGKIGSYESLLEGSLADLKQVITECETTTGLAVLYESLAS